MPDVTGPTLTRLEELDRRVAACEALVGSRGSAAALEGGLSGCFDKLTTDVKRVCDAQESILILENRLKTLHAWLQSEHGDVSHVLFNKGAKRQYLAQNVGWLQELAGVLQEVQDLESCLVPANDSDQNVKFQPDSLPKLSEQLKGVETRLASSAPRASIIHDHVAKLSIEYHKTIAGVNEQLLLWDSLLSKLPSP
eukprot:TRINITY_DN71328_c0_g1_i1.p1 TRINITY_DN71328_c0_g1~~TRINITY_DN71328_c0_g1_i1.p1  ORF type:complete len:196 (-),score=30.69 TRINITY_DN71328_c0_g1_i1:63-650(-)